MATHILSQARVLCLRQLLRPKPSDNRIWLSGLLQAEWPHPIYAVY